MLHSLINREIINFHFHKLQSLLLLLVVTFSFEYLRMVEIVI